MAAPKISITVDDRKLRELIAKTAGKGPVKVVADGVEYALYQEWGTSKMPAQPFMTPAVEAVRPGFAKAFEGAITNDQAEKVVTKTAFDVERLAKQNAAVDTGAMRASIHVVDGDTFDVSFESERG